MKANALSLMLLCSACQSTTPTFHADITSAKGVKLGEINGTYNSNKSWLETYLGLAGQILSQVLTSRAIAP